LKTPRASAAFSSTAPSREETRDEPRKPYDLDSLTDVALRVFAERGYDGATMDDVARAAGITKAAIYHHVAGKEALLERGLDRALGALFAILEEEEARRGPALARARFIVRRVAETSCSLLPELAVLFRLKPISAATEHALERRREFDRVMTRLVAEAQQAGELSARIAPALLARLAFGMSNSLVEWYRPEGALSPQALGEAVESLIFDGLRE
jgi:AcrR family transcriptional regulator